MANTSSAKNAGASSTEMLAANQNCYQRRITNLSDEDVSIGLGTAAVAGSGRVLKAVAATKPDDFIEFPTPGGFMWKGAINAICASGGKSCSLEEIST